MFYLFIFSLLLAGYANAAVSSVQSLTDSTTYCLDWSLNGIPGTAVEPFSFSATDFGFPAGTTYIPINSVTVVTTFRKYDEGDANLASNPLYSYYGNANVTTNTGNGCPPNTSPFYTCLTTPTHTDAVFFSECVFKIQRPSGAGAFLINKQWDSVSTDNTVRTITFTDSASVSAGSVPVPIDGTSYKPIDSFGSFLADATNPDGTFVYNLAANALGTWNFTITDSGTYDPTCYLNTVLTVKINLILDGSVTQPKCAGSSDGTITVTAQGGSGQYQIYQVNTGGTIGNMKVTGLPAGTYAVFVRELNGNGAIGTKSFTLTDYNAVQGSVQVTNPVSCSYSADGQITITPSGGTGTYSVSINPNVGSTSGMVISNLPQGTYTVTISDSNGCQFVISNIHLTAPSPVAVTVTQQSSCDTAKVTLSGSGGNGGPYTLSALPASWGAGTCSGTVPPLTYCGPAGAGLVFKLNDAKNCLGTSASTTLKLLSMSVSQTDATCFGSLGSITVTMMDSTVSSPAYGATVNGVNKNGIITTFSVAAGNYPVTGTDGQCTISYASNPVVINQPSDISRSETTLNCPDKYGIQITPSGGPTGTTYSITTTAGTVVWNTSPFIVQVPNTAQFSYTISAGGCSNTFSTAGSGSFTSAFAISPTSQSLPCLGKSYSFSHTLSGGTTPILATGVTSPTTTTYTTSANAVTITTQAPTTPASPYNFAVAVAIKDASLCSGTVTVTENYPQGTPSSSDSATLLCNGDSMDIPINIVQPGGYLSSFFISAVGPPSTITIKNSNTVTVSNQGSTSQVYPIKFDNTQSCGVYNTGTLTVTQPSVVTFSPTSYTYKCNGPTESFTITLSYSGYFVSQTSTPNTFTITAISPNTGGATVTPQTGNNFLVTVPKPTSTVTYTLTAITTQFVDSANSKKCTYSLTLTVNPPTTSPLSATAADSSCYNAPVATITISGGTSPYTLTYTKLLTGATVFSGGTVASPATVTLPAFDTYSFKIMDAIGCSTTVNNVAIANPPQIALTQTVTVYKCPVSGGSQNPRIDLAPYLTGGTGALCATAGSCNTLPGPSCTWVRIPISSSPTPCNVPIIDNRTCTQNVPIQEAIAPSIVASTSFSAGICPVNLVTITVTGLTGAAPTTSGGYSVAVTVGGVTKTVTNTQSQSFTFSGAAGGSVTLDFTDNTFWPGQPGGGSTKCSNSQTVTIPALPVDHIDPSPTTLTPKCYGDPVSSLSPSTVSFSGSPSPPYTLNSVTPSELCTGSPTLPASVSSVNLCPTQFTNYVFSFTDSNSCTVTSTVNVTPNTNPISVDPVVMPCNPSTTVNVTPVFSGGPGPTYTINSVKDKNNNVVTVSSGIIQGVTYNNSPYTINVKSCNSATPTPLCCTQDVLLTSLYQPLQATFTVTTAPCPSQSNGKIQVTVTNGSGNPSITSVTPGPQTVITVSPTVYNITNLPSGTYSILINDVTAMCQYTLSAPLNNGPDLLLSVVDKSCNTFGNYDFVMNSGRSGSAYSITGTPTSFGSSVNGNVIHVTGLTFNQAYNFVITDTSTGCVVNLPITSNTPPYAVTYTPIPSLACFGDKTSVQLHVINGAYPASVNITGVTSPATYSASLLVSNIPAGSTVVNFQDYYGCTFSTTLSVTGPTQIALTPAGNALTCPGVPQSFTFTASGGTGGLYPVTSYEITSVSPASPPTFVPGTLQLDTVSAGTYSINFRANLNNPGPLPPTACSSSTSFTVTQSPFVVTTIPSPAVISCNTITQQAQLAVVQLVVSGSGGPTYTIDCASFLATYSGTGCDSATLTLSNLGDNLLNSGAPTQSYNVIIKDRINCAYTYTLVVQRPSVITVNKTPHTTSCSTSSDGSLDITITGGVPPYYVNGNTVTSQPFTITSLSAGTGQITVQDSANPLQTAGSGCTTQVSYTITSPAPLSVSFVDKSCDNQAKFSVSTSGAQGSWSILSVSPNTFTIQGGTTVVASTWGSYSVTVKDSKNCQATNSINLLQPQPLAITPTSYQLVCSSPLGSESQAFICSGGTSSSTCTISTVSPSSVTYSGLTISHFVVGAITIGLTDGNGCSSSVQFTVLAGPAITATVSPSTPTTSCYGINDGTASFSGNNGKAPYSINTLVGGSYNTPLSGLSVSGLQGGISYSVTLKDSNNCVSSILSFNVNQPSPILGTLQDYSCYNNGRIQIQPTPSDATVKSVQGNTGAYTVAYNNGVILISGLNFGQSTTVSLQDSHGCITTLGPITLNNPSNVVAQSITRTSTTCPGGSDGSVQFQLVGGTGSLSITSPTTNVVFVNPFWKISSISAASFPVTVTDGRSCQYTITMFTTQPNPFSITYNPHPQPSCASNHDGSADFQISGSNGGPFSVVAVTPQNALGQPSFTGTTVNAVDGAAYTVTVRDNKGCLANTTMQITPTNIVSISIGAKNTVTCAGGDNGGVAVYASGIAPYTITVTPTIQPSQILSIPNQPGAFRLQDLAAGTYTITILDGSGCTGTETVIIGEPPPITGVASTTQIISCEGFNDGIVRIPVTGGTTSTGILQLGYTFTINPSVPYTFVDDNTFEGFVLTNLKPGIYTYTISDLNSCSASNSFTLTEPILRIIHPVQHQQWPMYLRSIVEWSYIPDQHGNDIQLNIILENVNGQKKLDYGVFSALTTPNNQFEYYPHNIYPGIYYVVLNQSNGCPRQVSYPLIITARPNGPDGYVGKIP